MNIQGCFPLGLTTLISLLSKGLSRVFSTTFRKHQLFSAQPSWWSNSQIRTWLLKPKLWLNGPLSLLSNMLSRFSLPLWRSFCVTLGSVGFVPRGLRPLEKLHPPSWLLIISLSSPLEFFLPQASIEVSPVALSEFVPKSWLYHFSLRILVLPFRNIQQYIPCNQRHGSYF